MKYFLLIACVMQGFFFQNEMVAQKPAYQITTTIADYDGPQVFLGYRRADKVYSKDTTQLVDGKYIFEGTEPLAPGIYLILMPPDNKFFEFVVTKQEQTFSMETAAPDFNKNLKFKGSKDNVLLQEYQRYMSTQVERSKKIQEKMTAETDAAKKAALQKDLEDISKKVREHQNEIVRENPATYTAKVIRIFQEPEIPPLPKKEDGTLDSSFTFKYYKAHYWDGFDFTDEVFVNTPYLKEKTDRYLDKMTVQTPDSVIAAVDLILKKSQANTEFFKYLLPYVLNKYYTPEIMGLDAVYVHLSDNYYKNGKADWVTPENLKKITDDAYMIRGVLMGNPAPDVRLQRYDPAQKKFTEELVSPYDVKADYTVIFMWKPGCGHCKHMTEELIPFYNEWKSKGVEIFSISSANSTELEKAAEDVQKEKMPWIVGADPHLKARALQKYYGTSLPKLFLLDKNKKIIANRVGVAQLPQIIEAHKKTSAQQNH